MYVYTHDTVSTYSYEATIQLLLFMIIFSTSGFRTLVAPACKLPHMNNSVPPRQTPTRPTYGRTGRIAELKSSVQRAFKNVTRSLSPARRVPKPAETSARVSQFNCGLSSSLALILEISLQPSLDAPARPSTDRASPPTHPPPTRKFVSGPDEQLSNSLSPVTGGKHTVTSAAELERGIQLSLTFGHMLLI